MIALVTGIAIAALVVSIFDFCNAIFNSSPILSGCSNTVEFSGKPSISCIKNFSRTHSLFLLLFNCASLIW